jgi:hypothetical protein
MKRAMTAVAAALVCITATLPAQAPPNFAGKWTLVVDPNAAPAGGGRGMGGIGQSAAIVQDATTLTITRTTQVGEFTSTYKLDGTESKNTMNMGGNAVDLLSKAKWEGSKLTVATTMNIGGNPVETSMVMALDPDGNLLVETTRPDFQGGGAPITTKATYKKS